MTVGRVCIVSIIRVPHLRKSLQTDPGCGIMINPFVFSPTDSSQGPSYQTWNGRLPNAVLLR